MSRFRLQHLPALAALAAVLFLPAPSPAQLLDQQKLLEAQTFWDNRDWDWYREHIPFFESPDPEIDTTYYYRWELVTKHLTYGSPDTGYSFTEFIDRPFWSGAYGAISCPAGHQLYEVRWLRDPRFARDYARYWFRTPGAEPRRYSTWLADAVWAVHQVHPDEAFVKDLLPDLIRNYEGWEQSHFAPEVGLFWQTGHDDGMEININSRQTQDTVRGAPGYRPTLNSYLWADARAIAKVARLAGDAGLAEKYLTRAAGLKEKLQALLWDPGRQFFIPMYRQDEERDGHVIKALTLTYQTGRFAGDGHGRELIGYVPWQFNLPDPGHEAAWERLMDREGFFADFGPTVTERRDPQFLIAKTCCVWSGQSWPYATTQTLIAMANLLHGYPRGPVTRDDYFKLLKAYTRTHRKDGRPYIAEAAHPDTGSWDGHDAYNHSEHYFHSGYNDLIITGLVGLRPRDDDVIEVRPLAPDGWDYFALDNVAYHGRTIAVVWDRTGGRYRLGPGLHLLTGGKVIASLSSPGTITARLPPASAAPAARPPPLNYAVNNSGRYFPRASASYSSARTPLYQVNDGHYWYHASPPNRWTCEGSPDASDWVAVAFGTARKIHTVKLHALDDGGAVAAPARIDLEAWKAGAWAPVAGQARTPERPAGQRANVIRFPGIETERIRVVLTHAGASRSGLSEIEALGDGAIPVPPAPPPAGNLAVNPRGQGFPRVSASFTSRHDRPEMANDGLIVFRPTPHNRWTSFESPNTEDWLEVDLGEKKDVGRVVLHIYTDGGGVQAPERLGVQLWDGEAWQDAPEQRKTPADPQGGVENTVVFRPVRAAKVRAVFTHRGRARSGVTELEAWGE